MKKPPKTLVQAVLIGYTLVMFAIAIAVGVVVAKVL